MEEKKIEEDESYFQVFDIENNDDIIFENFSDKNSSMKSSSTNLNMIMTLEKKNNSIKFASLNKIIENITDLNFAKESKKKTHKNNYIHFLNSLSNLSFV